MTEGEAILLIRGLIREQDNPALTMAWDALTAIRSRLRRERDQARSVLRIAENDLRGRLALRLQERDEAEAVLEDLQRERGMSADQVELSRLRHRLREARKERGSEHQLVLTDMEIRSPVDLGDDRVWAEFTITGMVAPTHAPGLSSSFAHGPLTRHGDCRVALRRIGRGTPEHPCEECGAISEGHTLDRGLERCNGCGYPGQ